MVKGNPDNETGSRRAPRILEIGDFRLMREAYPETTDHWSTSEWPISELDPKHDRLSLMVFFTTQTFISAACGMSGARD